MIHKFMHQFGWKMLSLALATLLWLLVVNYEDPTITRPISDIKVEQRNTAAITSQNKAIEYKSGQTVDIIVSGRRSIIDKLSRDDISAYADLRNVSITGAVDIEFNVRDGVDVIYKSPADMRIAWEDIIKVQKEIQYYFSGDVAEGYVALAPELTPNRLQISGPESKVNLVSSVILPVTISGAESDLTLYITPQLLDGSKNDVQDVAADIEKVQVRVPIQKMKSVDVVFSQSGEPDEGYALTKAEIDVTSLAVRGYAKYLDVFNQIVIDDILLTGKTEKTTINIDLANYLPDGVFVNDQSSMATLQITIEPVVDKDVRVGTENVAVNNIPEGFEFNFAEETEIVLKLEGVQKALDLVTIEELLATVNLTQTEAGTYEVPLEYSLPEGVVLTEELPMLSITLTQIREPDSLTPVPGQ